MPAETISMILGMKVRSFRQKAGLSLKALAEKTGVSASYLNEIEKGKKYPKTDKIMALAESLEVPYDKLVSLKLDKELNPLSSILDSPFIKEFPFQLFGISVQELMSIITPHPREMGTLVRMLTELGHTYDMRVEHFYYTALRCYQVLHKNYFPELEKAVGDFRREFDLIEDALLDFETLREILEERFSYKLGQVDDHEELADFRAVSVPGPMLLINSRLHRYQKTFIAASELGYVYQRLRDRAISSPSLEVGTFETVHNNFKASYFAGALLMPRDRFKKDLSNWFAMDHWQPDHLLELLSTYRVTPEVFFYRLSELMPRFFKTEQIHFLKFTRGEGEELVALTKHLNMSTVNIPHGLGLKEHFCGRWLSVSIIDDLERSDEPGPIVGIQRSHFIGSESEFFCIAVAFRGSLNKTIASVTVGFQMNDALRKAIAFWNDPNIPHRILGQTCERCPLTRKDCEERIAPPTLYDAKLERERKRRALDALMGR